MVLTPLPGLTIPLPLAISIVAAFMARIGSDSNTLRSKAMAAMRQWSGLLIGPVQENFGWRFASNMPQ